MQREEIQNGLKVGRMFVDESEEEALRWPIVEMYKPEESEKDTVVGVGF